MIQNHLPSNCYSSKIIESIDGAVIHYISAKNVMPNNPFDRDAIIDILKEYKVSYKYLIERDGTIIELVPGNYKTYHGGYSRMNGRDDCNRFTVGIALVGGSAWAYTDEQMIVLGKLLGQSMTENQYTLDWVKGHDEVRESWINKHPEKADSENVQRKYDPGAHFEWEILQDMLHGVSFAVENGKTIYKKGLM